MTDQGVARERAEPKWIDDLSDDELLAAVEAAMDDEGFAVSWRLTNALQRLGFRISPQGMAGRLRRHPGLTYDYDYATGRGRKAWRRAR